MLFGLKNVQSPSTPNVALAPLLETIMLHTHSDFSSSPLNQTVNITCTAAGKTTVFPGMDALRLSILLQRYHYHPGFRV